MNLRSVRSRLADGFTLIELLTVITIIAILMAMLFPFIQGAKESAKNRKADSDVRTIVHAVEQYNVEYGQYPRLTSANAAGGGAQDDTCGDPVSGASVNNSNLFNVLRDIDAEPNTNHSQNTRRQVFMDTKVVSNPEAPRDGFMDKQGGSGKGVRYALYDPWGMQYGVIIDSNSDNMLDVQKFYTDFGGQDSPRATVGAFSMGKDKVLGSTKASKMYRSGSEVSDDHLSWANR
jgi:prepilin-type N-terminal cleavage/methylation domain-containing protein